MIIRSELAETAAALNTAHMMCAAARTAPKTRGIDNIVTMILTDDDVKKLSQKMIELADGRESIIRDAGNVLGAKAVVMIGVKRETYGLNCGYCGHETCEECIAAKGACIFATTDMGIAIGSAVATASELKTDNRVMYSIGKIFREMDESGDEDIIWMGIPLSVSGKNPFFDRRRK
ncbi:MAG: DUF2148 domain-containing protein [Lachnospiraceae bacterium]|nr:DUF2148 domain-containing protein [Lachnospiraceae bacterium]